MMDEEDQWMTVGKPKKVKSGENENVVDQEEETMKLITSLKLNGAKQEIIAPKKTQIPVKIKGQSEQKVQKPKKKPELPVPFTFKTLQAALHSLDIADLRSLLDATKLQFNNDVIMLKTAVSFLNEKLRLEKADDVMFFDKPLDFPTSILPNELKSILKELIQKCNDEALKYFFHNLLQSLCEELNKSRNFVGNLLLLQQIAHYLPAVCISNLASTVILRNSYQNQPSICLSLFWALVSSGYCNTTIGLKVWMEIVSSVLNIKSYTKFTIDCLHKILVASEKTPDLEISLEEYKTLVELLLSNQEKLKTKDFQKAKMKCIAMVTKKYIKSINDDQLKDFFQVMFTFCKRNPEIFSAEFVRLLKSFPVEVIDLWRKNFDNFSRQNPFIFGYLDNNVQESEKLIEHPKFLTFIRQIDYKNHPNLVFVRDIPAKMTENKKQKKEKKGSEGSGCSGCCKWVFGSFLLFGAIGGLIAYDTNVLHGGKFEDSSVGRVLKQTGALPHVENAWFVSMKYGARGYKWAEVQAPIAYTKTRTFMQPYCEFTKDLGLTVFNGAVRGWESTKAWIAEKTPGVIAFTDKYVPGVGQKVVDFLDMVCKGFCKLTCGSWSTTKDFFATKVFVGHLSPENLGKAYTSTQQKALSYYSWIYEKVDVYAKLK